MGKVFFIVHYPTSLFFALQERPVVHTSLNVQKDNASPKLGPVMGKMTVEISLMNNIALVRKLSYGLFRSRRASGIL